MSWFGHRNDAFGQLTLLIGFFQVRSALTMFPSWKCHIGKALECYGKLWQSLFQANSARQSSVALCNPMACIQCYKSCISGASSFCFLLRAVFHHKIAFIMTALF